MDRQPGGDNAEWERALAHRPPELRDAIRARLTENGVTPEQVEWALADGGDALFAAARAGGLAGSQVPPSAPEPTWADQCGGALRVALLAAEVSALAAHLNSRASAVRALAVDALLDEFSAVTVATRLGVSRQKVYELSRGKFGIPFIDRVPWRSHD